MQLHEHSMLVGSTRLHLRRKGNGAPILFLHGAAGVAQWLPFFDELARDHAILVPDHPGFGASDDHDGIQTVADLAIFYRALIEQLDLRDVHLIGNSLGGWVAAELAASNLAPLRTLTLISPAGVARAGFPFGDVFGWSKEQAARNLYFDQALSEQVLARRLTQREIDIQMRNRASFTKLAFERRLVDPALEDRLSRIRIPVHLVWGADDRLLPAGVAESWTDRIPDASCTMISDCGHLPHVEQCRRVADDVLGFLEQHRK